MRPFFVIVLLCASAAAAAEFPGIEFETVELSNGLRLYVAEDRFQPVVTLRAVVAAGDRYNPPGAAEIPLLTAYGLCRGIAGLEGYMLDKQIEKLGADFTSGNDHDAIYLAGNVLEKNWLEALRIFSEMLINPTFPKQEISLLKKQRIEEWKTAIEDPIALGMGYSMNALYGEAYKPFDAERGVSKVSRRDIARFHEKYFRPERTSIVVIGDFESSDAIAALRGAFEKWPRGGEAIESIKPRAPAPSPPKVRLIHKPGLTQATVIWGLHGISRADTSRFALRVADWVLGGSGFSSRLTSHLRSEGGRTYGIETGHRGSSDDGQYGIVLSTRYEGLTATIDTIRTVTVEFVREGMTQEEFEQARGSILGGFPIQYETPWQIALGIANFLALGLSLDDFRSVPSSYQAVTIEKANRIASQVIRPDEMIWIVVGDKSKIGEDLKRHFGKIQTIYYKDGVGGGSFIKRMRLGIGGTWNSAARGPRLSVLSRRVFLSGTYGFGRSNDTWDYDHAWQATLDLHRNKSEYSTGSLFIGATGTSAGDVIGISPHVGYRIFPYAVRYHYSIATDVGWSFWDKGESDKDLPGFYWSIGLDYFF